MSDRKLSELTELVATPANDDEVYIRDVSEAAADESKRITTANLGADPPLSHLIYQLTSRAHVIYVPCLAATDLAAGGGWTAVTGGVGSSCSLWNSILRMICDSDIGDATYYRAVEPVLFLPHYRGINWNKELYLQFYLVRFFTGAGANEIEGYVQLKHANTKGAFGNRGIGIRIKGTDGLDIRGESYNTAEGTADFNANLIHSKGIVIGIHHRPGVSVNFYVNGTLQTNNITGANEVPATEEDTGVHLVTSLETTDDPNATVKLAVGGFLIIQAY